MLKFSNFKSNPITTLIGQNVGALQAALVAAAGLAKVTGSTNWPDYAMVGGAAFLSYIIPAIAGGVLPDPKTPPQQ